MKNYTILPKVDETQEFIEIANDFSNPLDIIREGLSNAFDAGAKSIEISFNVIKEYGESILEICIKDDGKGMDVNGLQAFFDLGNSLSRGDEQKIGEKGHGTKVYFNSSSINVTTVCNDEVREAVMKNPIRNLHDRIVPKVEVKIRKRGKEEYTGTEIKIKGYNSNRREKFTHEELKDYIVWFTKMGSIEPFFDIKNNVDVKLLLKGLNRKEPESIDFGHSFPDQSLSVNKLFDKHLVSAPDFYCKRFIRTGQLKNFPEISYEAIFSIEGNKVKQNHNPMIRRQGMTPMQGSYNVAERYGVWLCKDFIPVQRKNEWVNYKGSEFIKLHSFFNCQGLRLTANRGSIDNTPSEILSDIEYEVKKIYDDITSSDDWTQMSWLETEASGFRTSEKEKRDFDFRVKKVGRTNICKYKELLLVEPQRESGVFALTLQIMFLEPNIFPFYILDYDTHSGIDVIVKGDKTIPIQLSKLYYVEFKHYLTEDFNHSFSNLSNIICWDTNIKHDEILADISKDERKFEIIPPENEKDYTRYFINKPTSAHKIEVFVLKDYLKEKLGIEFRPRTTDDTV